MISLDVIKMRLMGLNKREQSFAVIILMLLVYLVFDVTVLGPYLKSTKAHAQARELVTVELNNLRKKRADLMAELVASESVLSGRGKEGDIKGVYSEPELNLWIEKVAVTHSLCITKLGLGRLTPMGGGLNKHELFASGGCSWSDLSKLLRDVRDTRGQLSSFKIDGDGESLLNFSISYEVLSKSESPASSVGGGR